MQSPLRRSRSERPRCSCRVYNPVTCSMLSPRCSAMARISSSLTHTKPGCPVQQSPQRVQRKRSPSWYQASSIRLPSPLTFVEIEVRLVRDQLEHVAHLFEAGAQQELRVAAVALGAKDEVPRLGRE